MSRELLFYLLIVCAAPFVTSERFVYSQESPRNHTETSNSGIKRCTGCWKEVPWDSKVGDKCPHCGGIWSSETYASRDIPSDVLGVWFAVIAFIVVGTPIHYFIRKYEITPKVALAHSRSWARSPFVGVNRICIVPLQRGYTGCRQKYARYKKRRETLAWRREQEEMLLDKREEELAEERRKEEELAEELAQEKRKEDLYELYLDMMCCVMCADGEVHPLEVRKIREVLETVGIPWDDESIKTRLKAFVYREETEGIKSVVAHTLTKIWKIDVRGNGRRLLAL